MKRSIPFSTSHNFTQWATPFSTWSFRVGCLLLVAVWLWYAGPLLWGQGDLFLVDTGVLDLPNRIHCANEIRGGNLPFWTDRIANGWSPMGENQTGIFYPFFLLYILAPTPQTHDFFMAVHYLLAGIFAYIYLSRHFIPLAALAGAVSFMAAPLLQRTHTVPGTIQIACWLPLCLLCIDLRLESGSKRAIYSLALINTIMTFAGFPQLALTVFTLEVIYYLAMGGWRLPSQWIKDGAIAFLLAGLLSAPQNVPTYFFLKESSRSEAFNWEYFRSTATPIVFLLNGTVGQCVLNPKYSFSFDSRWVPLVALTVLLLGSLVVVWKRPFLRFWLLVGVLGVLLATDTPFLRILYYLPVYNWFRWHSVYLLFTTMGVATLVAGFIEAILHRVRSPVIQLTIISISIAALSFHHMGFYLSDKPVYGQIDPAITKLKTSNAHFRLWPMAEAHSRAAEKGYFSTDTMLATARTACANYNLMQDVPVGRLIHQFQTVVTREFFDYYHPDRTSFREDLPTLVRSAANTHVSSDMKLPNSYTRNLDPIKDGPDVWLYEVQNPLPRAWMVYQTESIPESQERLARLSAIRFDAGRLAITERKFPEFEDPTIPPEIQWQLLRPDAIQIDIDTETAGLLVVSDTWSPYFHAEIDGQTIPIERVNHTFRGISIPSGKHSVIMYYWSTSFLLSVTIASIASIVLVFQVLSGENVILVAARYLLSAMFGMIAVFSSIEVMRGPTAPIAEVHQRIETQLNKHNKAETTGLTAVVPRAVVHSIELDEDRSDAKRDFDLTFDSEIDGALRFEVRTTSGKSLIDESNDYSKGVGHFHFSIPRQQNEKKCILSVYSGRQLNSISLAENQVGKDYVYALSDWCIESTFALGPGAQGGRSDVQIRIASPTNQTISVVVAERSGQSSFYHLLHLTEGTRTYSVPYAGSARECLVIVRGRGTWPFRIDEIAWRAAPKIEPKIDLPKLEIEPPSIASVTERVENTLEVDVKEVDSKKPWAVMLVKRSAKVESNKCLLATFSARSEPSQIVPIVLAADVPPSHSIAPIRQISLAEDWKRYRIPFVSNATSLAQLQIQLGGSIGKYCIRDLEIDANPFRVFSDSVHDLNLEQAEDPEAVRFLMKKRENGDSNSFVTIEYDCGDVQAQMRYQLQLRARSTVPQNLSVELIVDVHGELKSEYSREIPLTERWTDIHAEVLANYSSAKSMIRLRWRNEPSAVELTVPEVLELDTLTQNP